MQIKVVASGSDGNCYIVDDGVTKVLLECGIKYKKIVKALDYDINSVSACIISHSHSDHTLACADLYSAGVDLYMPFDTADEIKNKKFLCKMVSAGKQFKVGTFLIVPFENNHYHSNGEPCTCYGYLLYSEKTEEKLLFAIDTAYIKSKFKALDYIMIETNYISENIKDYDVAEVEKRRFISHQSLETAIDFLKTIDKSFLKCVYAIHLSKDRCDKDKVKSEIKKVVDCEVVVC